jgi:hypothetical protein
MCQLLVYPPRAQAGREFRHHLDVMVIIYTKYINSSHTELNLVEELGGGKTPRL